MTFKSVNVSIAALALLAVPFTPQAAELPMKAPIYKAPPPVVAIWTGCYAGANVGYGRAPTQWSDANGNFDSHTAKGVVGGGQIGCDHQSGPWVFGIQGMLDGAGMKGESHRIIGALGPNIFDQTRISWFGAVTGRIGYTMQPETLLYVKGGAAWVHDKFNECCLPPAQRQEVDDGFAKATRTGWTAGLGVEHMFRPHWSVFLEYDFIGLGTEATTFTPTPPTTAPFVYNIRQDFHTILMGVNYRF